MREYTDSLTLPLLELYTTPLLTDSSLLDSYLAAAVTDPPADADPPTDRSTS